PELGLLNVISKTSTSPSASVGLLTAIVITSLSSIVPVPKALSLYVSELVTVNVKVSSSSTMLSSVLGTLNSTSVTPAGIVIAPVVHSVHVCPPSVLYSYGVSVSVPIIAVPSVNAGINSTGPELGLLSVISKTNASPSASVGLLTAIVITSLSSIVPVPNALSFSVSAL